MVPTRTRTRTAGLKVRCRYHYTTVTQMDPENPEGSIRVGSLNMGCVSDTPGNRTHNLSWYKHIEVGLGIRMTR